MGNRTPIDHHADDGRRLGLGVLLRPRRTVQLNARRRTVATPSLSASRTTLERVILAARPCLKRGEEPPRRRQRPAQTVGDITEHGDQEARRQQAGRDGEADDEDTTRRATSSVRADRRFWGAEVGPVRRVWRPKWARPASAALTTRRRRARMMAATAGSATTGTTARIFAVAGLVASDTGTVSRRANRRGRSV